MNIHEHQAKQILKKYGATVPKGVFSFSVDEIVKKAKELNNNNIEGIIVGKAIYDGDIKLAELVKEINA